MNKTGKAGQENQSPFLQKLLLICAALILCALVYVFVSTREQNTDGRIILVTPAPSIKAETQKKPTGVRKEVFLENLTKTELEVGKYDEKTQSVPVSLASGNRISQPYTAQLLLLVKDGYMRGFMVELPALNVPAATRKNMDDGQKGLSGGALEKYEYQLQCQQKIIHILLFETVAVLDTRGELLAPVLLYWEAIAEEQLKDGDKAMESSGPFTYTVTRSRTGLLTVSLSL